MPRGRKPQGGRLNRPPKGCYWSYMSVLDAVTGGQIAPVAAHLWQVIRAYGLQDGYCSLTDTQLGWQLGGFSIRHVARLRGELRAAGLLAELAGPPGRNLRQLMALTGSAEGSTPMSGDMDVDRHGPKEEEELINPSQINLERSTPPLPGTDAPVNARAVLTCAREGAPEDPTPMSGEDVDPPNEDSSIATETAQLTQILQAYGVFPSIAAGLAPQFIERLELDDARAQVYAWWLTVQDGASRRRGSHDDDDLLRGRLVARLRAAAGGATSPPRWALDRAERVIGIRPPYIQDAAYGGAVGEEPDGEPGDEADGSPDGEPEDDPDGRV